MDLFEAIKKRHSYRGEYVDQPVPREDLCKIVQAGIDAPSGCNAQTTSFVIVDDPETISRINEVVRTKARAAIVCITDPAPVYKGMTFCLEDCSAAVENMLLAITAMGYATVWTDGALRGGNDEIIGGILGVPKDRRVQIILPIGIPVEIHLPRDKKPFEQRAWFNKYEG